MHALLHINILHAECINTLSKRKKTQAPTATEDVQVIYRSLCQICAWFHCPGGSWLHWPPNFGCALGMNVWGISKWHVSICILDVIWNLCPVVCCFGNKAKVEATLNSVQVCLANSDLTLWSGLTHRAGFAVSMNRQNKWWIQWRTKLVKPG